MHLARLSLSADYVHPFPWTMPFKQGLLAIPPFKLPSEFAKEILPAVDYASP